MHRKCALLFLLFYTSACFENDVVPLELENTGREKKMLKSDNNVIVLPEGEEKSIEDLDIEGHTEDYFGHSKETFPTGMSGMMQKTVKRYHCSVDGRAFLQNQGW